MTSDTQSLVLCFEKTSIFVYYQLFTSLAFEGLSENRYAGLSILRRNWSFFQLLLFYDWFALFQLFFSIIQLRTGSQNWVVLGYNFSTFRYHPKNTFGQIYKKPIKTQIIPLFALRLLNNEV